MAKVHGQIKEHLIQVDGEYRYVNARQYLIHKAYADENNIIRWVSNNNIPFEDMLMKAGVDFPIRKKCEEVRDEETAEAVRLYIQRQDEFEKDTSPEAMALKREQEWERRAALGPGKEVVDVISGRRYRT